MKSFSVIIPSYNSIKFIKETIDSIINTDYNKGLVEVIIIDDGSLDGSYEYINELIKEHSFIKQIKKENGNWGSVINYVRQNKLVKNELVSILDSDDRYLKETFKIVNENIKNADIFAGSFARFNGTKITRKVHPYWFLFKKETSNKNQMNTPYCLPLPFFFKKEIFYKLQDLKEGVAFQDPDFFSQIIKNSKSLSYSRKIVGLYFYNRENNSRSVEWDYHKRFEPELYACYKLIENGAAECVSYRLNTKPFFYLVKKHNIKFDLDRKLSFKWFPWYLRWIYFLIYFFKQRKIFNIIK